MVNRRIRTLPTGVVDLTRLFAKAQQYAANLAPELSLLSLRLGCPVIQEERATLPGIAGKRAYAHVGHYPNIMCMAWEAVELEKPIQLGLIFHEFGHVLSGMKEEDSEEIEADMAAFNDLGVRVEYSDRLKLQYLHPDDITKVMT